MKQISQPEDKKEQVSPEEKAKLDKIKTYIITGVIIVALGIYMIISALPEKTPGEEENNDSNVITTSAVITTEPDVNKPDNPYINNIDNNNALDTEEDKTYTIPSNYHATLYATNDLAACYMYIPEGFVASQNPRSITLKPDDLDLTADGNYPLRLQWSSVTHFNTLKTEKIYEDELWNKYTKNIYEVIHEYDYVAHANSLAHVYVIKHSKEIKPEYADQLSNSVVYYIVLDIEYEKMYPNITITETEIQRFHTKRYPDLISLVEAMFRPMTDATETPELPEVTESSDTIDNTKNP